MPSKRPRQQSDQWPGPFAFPRVGTKAARDFWVSFEQINRFAFFILQMATQIDGLQPALHKARLVLAKNDAERQRAEELQKTWRGPLITLAAHAQFFAEVFVVREVENYLSYLSALLFEILAQKPEAMRSQEKVDLEFVLEHQSWESLVRGLAERKVDALSYSSFEKVVEFFQDHFKLSICSQRDLPIIREYIEARNISVHNRCIVNRRYLEKLPDSTLTAGTRLNLGIDELETIVPALYRSVLSLDTQARAKLRLKGKRFNVTTTLRVQYDEAHARYTKRAQRSGSGPQDPSHSAA